MSIVGSNALAGASGQSTGGDGGGGGGGGGGGFQISRSLRLNVADTPELTRTPSSAGNTSTFTISFWAKRCKLGSTQMIVQTDNTYSNLFRAYWDGNDNFVFHQYNGSYVMSYVTTAKYRDPSAWYHYVIAIDTTQATAADRARLYVNGVEVTDFSATTDPAQNLTTGWNAAIVQRIGREYTTTYGNYYNVGGYIAEFHNVDGQQLAATDFGEFDANNVWQPKEYTHGTAKWVGDWIGNTTGTPYSAGTSAANAFDGNSSTQAAPTGDGSMTFTPSSPITGITKVRIRGQRDSGTSADMLLNGTSIKSSWNDGQNAKKEFTVNNLTSLEWQTDSGNLWMSVRSIEIEVDGVYHYLVQGGINDFHLNFSDNSSNAALGTDSSGVGTNLPGVDFDGSNDHVESADHADYSLGTNDFTLEAYIYPRTFDNYKAIVMKYAGNASNSSWWWSLNSSGHILFYLYYGSSEVGIVTSGTGMTLNKWNHVACVRDGSTARVYINGVQAGTGNISTYSVNDSSTAVRIGEDSQGVYDFDGIISNVRLINGTCLYTSGTTFTLPATPLTNVTNTKLLCCQSSSSATAATVSPNTLTTSGDPFATQKGENDFTVTNLAAAGSGWNQSQTWSSLGTGTAYSSSYVWTNAFNGDNTSNSATTFPAISQTMTWTPSSPITVNTSVIVYVYNQTDGSNYGIKVNGSYLPATGAYGAPITRTAAQLSNQLTNIELVTNSGALGPYLAAVEVDGVLLVDAGVADTAAPNIDSLIDTPTNYTAGSGNNGGNYCTLNPLNNSGQTLKEGNLECSGTSGRAVGTLFASSGKFYWEFTAGSSYTMAGIESSTAPYGASYSGENNQQYALYGNAGSGQLYHNGSTSSFDGFVSGDVIGVALDMDAGKLYFYKNGSAMNSGAAAATGLTGAWTANCRSGSGAYDGDTVFNFGARQFVYTPPTGYKSLCTTNLPQPTIADGSTAMDVKLWTGDDATSRAITGLNFSPDLLWIKSRSSSGWHALADSVRGAGKILASNAANSEYNDTDSQNAIQSFDSNGFTIGDQGSWLVNDNNITTVGWAWDAGDRYNSINTSTHIGGNWISMLSTESGTNTVTNPHLAFDGSPGNTSSTRAQASRSSEGAIVFTPTGGYTVNTQIRVYGGSAGDDCYLDFGSGYGSAISLTSGAWTTVYSGSGTLTKMKFLDDGSGSVTGLGGIEIDGKLLVDGVIPVGGLNSSIYNQSQTWSGLWSGTAGYGSFADLHNANINTDYMQSLSATMTLSSAITITSLRIRLNRYGANVTLSVNGTDVTSQLPAAGSGLQWVTITGFTSLSSIAVTGNDYSSNVIGLYAIEVNGALLIDSGVTVTNVPTYAATVRANPSAGVSIISYVGTGSSGNIAHGLNAAPEFFMIKNREMSNYDWWTWHKGIDPNYYVRLNSSNARAYAGHFFAEAPDSNVIKFEGGVGVTSTNKNHIVYAFAPVSGFSAFGKFSGNSNTDGPFQYCGFKPRFLLLKGITQARDWIILDTERDAGNVGDSYLHPNTSGAENTYAIADILSNGFKMRYSGGLANQTGEDYIWAAFASHPFKTARAR